MYSYFNYTCFCWYSPNLYAIIKFIFITVLNMKAYIYWINIPYDYLTAINVIRKNSAAKYIYLT